MKIWIARARRRKLAHKEYLAASPSLEYKRSLYFRENLLSFSAFEKILKIALCFTFPLLFAAFFLAIYLHNYFLGTFAIALLLGMIGKEIQYSNKLKRIAFKDKGKFRPLYSSSVTSKMLQQNSVKVSDVRLEFPKMLGRIYSYRKNQSGYALELGTKGLLSINRYKVNSFGDLGVPDSDLKRNDEHYSIICYGDSFSDYLGNGQDEEDYPSVEWPYYLLKQLTSKGLGSLPHETSFDVQNCSKCGSGLLQMLDNAEEYLQEFVNESHFTKNIIILAFISTDISRLPFSSFEYHLGGEAQALCHKMLGGYKRAYMLSNPININSYQRVLNHGGWSSELDECVHLGEKALCLDRLMYIRLATLSPNWLFERITGAPCYEKSQLGFTSHQLKPKMMFEQAKDLLLSSETNWQSLKKLAELQRLFILHLPIPSEVRAQSYTMTDVDAKILKLFHSFFPSSLFRIPIDSIRNSQGVLLSRTPWDHHPSKVLMKYIANYAYELLNSKVAH